MKIKKIYEDYLVIKNLNACEKTKIKLIETLCNQREHNWKVVGITKKALQVFKKNNYQRKSRMGINRAHHKRDRKDFYTYLLEQNLCFERWHNYLIEHDVTVLSTSSENSKNSFSKIYPIDPNGNFFKSTGIGWTHSNREKELLNVLCSAV